MTDAPDPAGVFINAPFDPSFEPLFITLTGTLVFLGKKPHCVVEVQEGGEGRLNRIMRLMKSCRVSIHDLSRCGTPARFNMPFELGLACGLQLESPNMYDVIVMESKKHRIDKTLSDYKGRDAYIHNGSCSGVMDTVLDIFATDVPDPASKFARAARILRASMRNAGSVFRPQGFRLLGAIATEIAVDHGFIES